MLKAGSDILTGAAISPEAILKALVFSKLVGFYVTFRTRMSWYMNEHTFFSVSRF